MAGCTTCAILSLRSGVVHEDLSGGVTFDLLPNVQVGGDYFFINYSDGNVTEGYVMRVNSEGELIWEKWPTTQFPAIAATGKSGLSRGR